MLRTRWTIWLGCCALVAVVSGALALNQLTSAGALGQGQAGMGNPAFWDALLWFHWWAFIACVAVLVGVVSVGIVLAARMQLWLVLCAIGGVGYAIAALNGLNTAGSFTDSSGGLGSAVWWEAYLRFHYWAWRSLAILGVGVISAGVVALLPTLEAALPAPQRTPGPAHRPLGVTLIGLYLVLATLVDLVPFLAQPLSVVAAVSVPLTLILAWGLWQCRSWARTLIVGVGIPIIGLSFLGGTAGFKTWILLAIVVYLFQPRVGEVFYTAP